ncbi:hypothetical protein K0A97_00485 [Patescibacteria group bacterium]|nr:hypothetical protein [Patescibacteria group bacterium]
MTKYTTKRNDNLNLESLSEHYQELEKKRVTALENKVPLDYFNFCEELGISSDNLEDPHLYEQGLLEKQLTQEGYNQSFRENNYHQIKGSSDCRIKISKRGQYDLEKVLWETFSSFSECQSGESVTSKELDIKLRNLQKLNFLYGPYSHLKKKEKWHLFRQIRAILYDMADRIGYLGIIDAAKKTNDPKREEEIKYR